MKKMISVCGLNPAWQKTLHFRTLLPGEVNRAYNMEQTASGKGINFCRAARHWGAVDTHLFQFAGGMTGKQLISMLDQEKQNHTTIFSEALTRTCSTVLSESPASVTELIEPSAEISGETRRQLFQKITDTIPQTDALAVCGTYPPGIGPDFYAGIIRKAADNDKFVMLDAFVNVEDSLKSGVVLLKINLEEISKLTGETDITQAFRGCCAKYPIRMLAVTAGPDTAYFCDRHDIWKLAVPKINQVINPIGAGDTCAAVMASEILTGTSPLEAFRYGLCAASASCLTASAADYDAATARKFYASLLQPEHFAQI